MSEHYMSLDTRVVRQSNSRLVLAGNSVELYTYERAYLYNLPPAKATIESDGAPHKEEERRGDNLTVARHKVRRLINANKDQYGEQTKFVTYTFAENVKSLKQAHKAWGLYCKKANYRWGKLRYLAVVEFQKRGAVHYHVLYFNLPYIKNAKQVIAKLWGKGFVNVKTIREVRNIGAYVCKYIQKDMMDSRLRGRKAYFCSRGLLKPREIRDPERIAEFLGSGIIEIEAEQEYESACYGVIKYQQGLITQQTYDSYRKMQTA